MFGLFDSKRKHKGIISVTSFNQDESSVRMKASRIKVSGNRSSNINIEGVQENVILRGGGANINIGGTQKNIVNKDGKRGRKKGH